MKTNHTSTPWEIDTPPNGYVRIIGGIDGDAYDDGSPRVIYDHVCDVIDNEREQENAQHIVKCVNLHDELLDLLCLALPYVEDALDDETIKKGTVKADAAKIRAAIAKAGAA